MKIASITDPLTANGLKLAGMGEVHEVENTKEAERIFVKIIRDEEIGIVLITEQLAKEMDETVLESKEEKEKITPIVIEIPSKEGPVPERREIIDKLVKRAVGIKVES